MTVKFVRSAMKWPTVNKPLLPLKTVLFCWFGASSCLLPYMTVHMKDLGLTVEETAIIYTLLPVIQLLSSPIAGLIADKLGQYKGVLVLASIITVLTGTGLLYVPPRGQGHIPDIAFVWNSVSGPSLSVSKCTGGGKSCTDINSTVLLIIDSCTTVCNVDQKLVNGLTHCPDITNLLDTNMTFSLEVDSIISNVPSCMYPIRSITPSVSSLYNLSCSSQCEIECPITIREEKRNTTEELSQNLDVEKIRCDISDSSLAFTFWLYFLLRIIFSMFNAMGFNQVDATAVIMAETYGSQYGRERLWGMLGMTLFSPIIGILVDYISNIRGHLDYSPAFHAYNILVIITAVSAYIMDVGVAPAEESVLKNLGKLIRLPAVIVLLIMIFWLGNLWGFVETFLFWYLEDLGSPNYLLGLTITIGCIVGIPFLYKSEWFLDKIGHTNLLTVALLVYFIRFIGYSLINDPWWCFPFEVMEIFTYHLMWVSAVTYSAQLTPEGLLATVQASLGGLHFGIGWGSGSFVGGLIMSSFGARRAFQIMGGSALLMGILYALLHFFWLRHLPKGPQIKRHSRQLDINHSSENGNAQVQRPSVDESTLNKIDSVELSEVDLFAVDEENLEQQNNLENTTKHCSSVQS